MEDFIIPLIIIVVSLLNFKKFKKNAKKGQGKKTEAAPKKSGGIFDRINKVLEEYAETVKVEKEDSDDDWLPMKEEAQVVQQVEVKKETQKQTVEKKRKPVIVQKNQSKVKKPYHQQRLTPQTLRQAIVWSEILAPPVSLREE